VSAALISPTGVIGPRLRVTPAGADFSDDCSITRGPGGALVVGWHVRGRDDEEIFIRQIAADGRLGPAVPVRPNGEPGDMWYMAPVAVTAEGRVAVGWTVGDDRGRGQHRMRWIEADGTAGPAIDLSPRTRDATELTLETAGDRAVAIVDDGGKVTAQDILPDATVGPRRTLLDARYTHSSSTSNSDKVAVVVQGITGGRSSIYVIERSGLNWRKPARLARGGPSNWPANQSIALNSDGQVAVAFNVSMALPIIAELGVRAVVSR
jgi:hypothetical protein